MTISDLARRAGCSKSTVARVLNNRPDVNPETRARILALMEEVSFVPDERARSLASGRSATIGLMVANLTSPYSHAMIRSFEKEARQAGYSVLLLDTSYDPSEEQKAVEILRRRRVDGVAVVPVGESGEYVHHLADLGIPTVLIARYFPDGRLDVVRHDNRGTGYLATQHLLALGHRRILYLSRDATISTVSDRLDGVRQAIAEAELAETTVTTRRTEAVAEGGYVAIRTLTQVSPGDFPYSAVIAYNDYCALGAQRALQEAGYRVPDDVSLVACSDSGIGDYLPVRLTLIRDDWTEVGRQAFQSLLRRITHPDEPVQTLVIPTELVARESTIALRRFIDR